MSRARQERASAFIFFFCAYYVSLQRGDARPLTKKRQRTVRSFLLLIYKLVILLHASLLKNRFLY